LSEVEVENADGSKVKQYMYDPFLRDGNGKMTNLLSPGAMIKTAVLIADIIARQGSYVYDEEKKSIFDWNLGKNLVQSLLSLILKLLMVFGIITAGIFFVLHYCMCIIEYYVVSAVGMLLVPCVLFEGTKDYAKRLVGLFAAYLVKIIVMSLSVFWAFSAFIAMGNTLIGSNQPITFLSFANFLFTAVLSLAVVSQAPKIAQGLLSGSPSMSMGDFTQAVSGALMGAYAAKQAAGGVAAAAKGARTLGSAVKGRQEKKQVREMQNRMARSIENMTQSLNGGGERFQAGSLYTATVSFGDEREKGRKTRKDAGEKSAVFKAPEEAGPQSQTLSQNGKNDLALPDGNTRAGINLSKTPPPPPPTELSAAKSGASSQANADAQK
jgi:type IV secretory pathway TrbL component